MSLISNYGPPTSPIWVLVDKPFPTDAGDGIIFSGGFGYAFWKTWEMAGLSKSDIHIHSLRPVLGSTYNNFDACLYSMLQSIEQYKPPIIIPMEDSILNYLVPVTKQQKEKNSSLRKWAGSLLTSQFISHPHYVVGTFPPDFITRNWNMHEIQAFIHFGHIKEEFSYWQQNGILKSLPHYNLIVEPPYDILVDYLRYLLSSFSNGVLRYVAADIETIRPKKDTEYYNLHHPGFPYTISFAPSSKEAIAFSLWDYHSLGPGKLVKLVRILHEILSTIPQIGQNYFTFDSHYLESLGYDLNLKLCHDTMLRHHILWPTLKHALQFQTLQYTRQPFYKDEGKQWSSKDKKRLLRYNALDSVVTYEIWERQEEEFNDRPHLR